MLLQPSQVVSLFLFSLFSLPVQKATLGTAGPAFKRYKCFRRPLQISLSFSFLSFSFLFSLYRFRKATLGRPVPPSNATNASAGPRRYLSFSFLFLFTGSESNVRHGRSRLQTLQNASAGPCRYLSLSLFFSLFLFSLFSLPVQKATLGTAGPAFKRYKCFRRPLQVSLSFSFLSFSFLFSLYRFRKQR